MTDKPKKLKKIGLNRLGKKNLAKEGKVGGSKARKPNKYIIKPLTAA